MVFQSQYIQNDISEDDDSIEHYGVMGMHWGVIRGERYRKKSERLSKHADKLERKSEKRQINISKKTKKYDQRSQQREMKIGSSNSDRKNDKLWNQSLKDSSKAEKYSSKYMAERNGESGYGKKAKETRAKANSYNQSYEKLKESVNKQHGDKNAYDFVVSSEKEYKRALAKSLVGVAAYMSVSSLLLFR